MDLCHKLATKKKGQGKCKQYDCAINTFWSDRTISSFNPFRKHKAQHITELGVSYSYLSANPSKKEKLLVISIGLITGQILNVDYGWFAIIVHF
jgi:hypothetical protein